MNIVEKYNSSVNFLSTTYPYCYFYTIFGYYGLFLTARYSFFYLYKFFSILFLQISKHKYKKFPIINAEKENSNINYVLFNWNCLNFESDRNMVKYLILEGYHILILVNREFKSDIIKSKFKFLNEIEKEEDFKIFEKKELINIKTFTTEEITDNANNLENITDKYSQQILNKLAKFHNFNHHISIFVNYPNIVETHKNEKYDISQKNLENNLLLTKVCIRLMLLDRGQSLIIGIIDSDKEYEMFFKNFYKSLNAEYQQKLEVKQLITPDWSSIDAIKKIKNFKNLLLNY